MKIIQLHVGLIRFLNKELRKKRTAKELILFLYKILKQYLKLILEEYKKVFLVFDIEYKKQKKEYEKYTQIQKDLQKAIKLLEYIDIKMDKAGLSRQRQRQFWLDFTKNKSMRKELFNELLNEINLWRR